MLIFKHTTNKVIFFLCVDELVRGRRHHPLLPTESIASIDGLFQVIDMAMNKRRFDVLF